MAVLVGAKLIIRMRLIQRVPYRVFSHCET